MSCSCIHTIQLYPSYVNNVIMYQTKRGHVRLNISVKEAEFETRYQLWMSTGTCAQCGSALPEEGTGSLAKIKCASTPISCLGGERQGKRHTRKEAYYSKDPVLQSANIPLASMNSQKLKVQDLESGSRSGIIFYYKEPFVKFSWILTISPPLMEFCNNPCFHCCTVEGTITHRLK